MGGDEGPQRGPQAITKESWWPTLCKLSLLLMTITLGVVLYQGWLLTSCHRQLGELEVEKKGLINDWEADRHSVEECKAEMARMEDHIKKSEKEKEEVQARLANA